MLGLPDDKWGERVCAVVQLRAGHSADPDELIAAVEAAIDSVKAPKKLDIWDDLPRSKVGKFSQFIMCKLDEQIATCADGHACSTHRTFRTERIFAGS